MLDFQQRLIDEKNELGGRINRLRSFFPTETFLKLPPAEQFLLREQSRAMKTYFDILIERIG